MLLQLGPWPEPRSCMPVAHGPPARGRGICWYNNMPGYLRLGNSCQKKSKVRPWAEGVAAGWGNWDPVRAVAPCPSRDPDVKPMLKRSHMKQSERRDSGCGCHMPQESLKVFQWNRPIALERLQAVQHWLSTLYWEACCEVDRVQLHAEKRDPLRRGEFAIFPVDLKPQPAEVTEHHIPVFAQQCSRLGQDEPVVEVVENANACFP